MTTARPATRPRRSAAALDERPDAVVACAGVRHHETRLARGRIAAEPLQVMHRRTPDAWTGLSELTTDDLD